MAALNSGRYDKMDILSITKYATQNWKEVTKDVLVQAPPNILENFPERLVVDNRKKLKVCVEGRNVASNKI